MTSPGEGVTVFTSPYLSAGAPAQGEAKGLIKDEKEIKTIDLRIKRNTYFNKDNDIILIELNENDNIKYFLELDLDSLILSDNLSFIIFLNL